jgi:hypothetical protein
VRPGLPVVDGQRVDQVSTYAIAHLQQARDGIEGVDPHEFGVEGNVWQLLPLGKTDRGYRCRESSEYRWPHGSPLKNGAQYISPPAISAHPLNKSLGENT